jgi:hypothetical protein
VAYFLALNMSAVKIFDGRKAQADVVVVEHDGTPVLPVFTKIELFRGFARAHFAEGDRVSPLATYPFELAEIAARLEAEAKIVAITFDPFRGPDGRWRHKHGPIPVAEYVRLVEEIRPGIGKLAAEAKARFGENPPGSGAFEEAVRRMAPEAEREALDAMARIRERHL